MEKPAITESELVRSVRAACGFGAPTTEIAKKIVGQVRELEKKSNSEGHPSAEQLAIALMAEARKLMDADHVLGGTELAVLGDRLARWASEVRQLGVAFFTENSSLRAALVEAENQVMQLGNELSDCQTVFADYRTGAEAARADSELDREGEND